MIVVDNASTDETPALLGRFENLRVVRNDRNLGFGGACNRGISLARGEFVCFLNDDTLVTPGWLDVLLETARAQPRCGGVGAKLVHPSGLLQEAGGIIWRDGSNSGYGRDADPSDPEYDYLPRRQLLLGGLLPREEEPLTGARGVRLAVFPGIARTPTSGRSPRDAAGCP